MSIEYLENVDSARPALFQQFHPYITGKSSSIINATSPLIASETRGKESKPEKFIKTK